jgi:hypothetical protein
MVQMALLILLIGSSIGQAESVARVLPPLLPVEREVALAESSAPPTVARHSSIFVLRRGGFVLLRKGQNGFTCFVARTAPEELEPICYEDDESTHSLVAREFREQQLRERGMSDSEVDAEIGQRYRRGELRPTQNFGVAYMLSPCNRVTDESGQIVSEHPHLMFYAPYATNDKLGLTKPRTHGSNYAPFILFDGEPWAFLIVHAEAADPSAKKWCEEK